MLAYCACPYCTHGSLEPGSPRPFAVEGAGCNREKFGGVGRLFAMLLVLLNCLLTECTSPILNRIQPSYYYYYPNSGWGGGDLRTTPSLYETLRGRACYILHMLYMVRHGMESPWYKKRDSFVHPEVEELACK